MTAKGEDSIPKSPDQAGRWLWLVAAGVGGLVGIFHLLGRRPHVVYLLTTDPSSSRLTAVGQLGLYAAPLFLGVLAGLFFRTRPAVRALMLSAVCLAIAAPMLGEGLVCFILIVPLHLVIAPLSARAAHQFAASRRRHLPGAPGIQLLLLLVPFGAALSNRLSPPEPAEPVTMVDTVVANAPREAVWRSIDRLQLRFTLPAPWLLRLGLPVPLEIQGGGAYLGAERRVLFSNGTVVAKVVGAEAPQRLDLVLSVEHPGREFFDHWSILGTSRFDLEELPGGRTRITHATTYRPLSFPRWYFGPVERYLGRKVQRYMLEAYARQTFSADERVSQL